ncbi:MAG: hypothetical protein P8J37_05280 [Fuerstiella sp.]|nr:hypothetical protein [Fuerstiella sp.]
MNPYSPPSVTDPSRRRHRPGPTVTQWAVLLTVSGLVHGVSGSSGAAAVVLMAGLVLVMQRRR